MEQWRSRFQLGLCAHVCVCIHACLCVRMPRVPMCVCADVCICACVCVWECTHTPKQPCTDCKTTLCLPCCTGPWQRCLECWHCEVLRTDKGQPSHDTHCPLHCFSSFFFLPSVSVSRLNSPVLPAPACCQSFAFLSPCPSGIRSALQHLSPLLEAVTVLLTCSLLEVPGHIWDSHEPAFASTACGITGVLPEKPQPGPSCERH